MIKKELRDILIPTILRLLTVLIVPTIALVQRRPWIVAAITAWSLGPVTYWIAHNLGINTFKAEHRDRSFEYMLTYPYSRFRLLVNKVAPRLAVLMVLGTVYLLMYRAYFFPFLVANPPMSGDMFFFFFPDFFPWFTLFFYFAGMFAGLFDWKNVKVIIGFVVSGLAVAVGMGIDTLLQKSGIGITYHLGKADLTADYISGIGFVLGAMLVLAIMGGVFFSIFKRFDLRPPGFYRNRYVLRVLPVLVLVASVAVFIYFKG